VQGCLIGPVRSISITRRTAAASRGPRSKRHSTSGGAEEAHAVPDRRI